MKADGDDRSGSLLGRAVEDDGLGPVHRLPGMNAERAMSGKTWGWDGTTWRELSATGPSPRIGSGIAYDAARHEVVLFGGTGATFTHTADTWLWNGRAWREAKLIGPAARGMGYMAFDRGRGVTVLFGGHFKFPENAAHAGVERQQLATRPLGARLRARIDFILYVPSAPIAQLDRASDFGSEGWGFESLWAHLISH